MKTMRPLTVALSFFLALVLLTTASPLMWSQEVTANIVGTVSDPTGAPIKGAAVAATDVDRGTGWNAETNGADAYNPLRLPLDTHTVKCATPGVPTVARAR